MKRSTIIVWAIVSIAVVISITYFAFPSGREQENPDRNELVKLSEDQFLAFKTIAEGLPDELEEVSLVAVGDIMPSRGVAGKMRALNDYNYPFLKTRDYLKTGDLVFGNLESPITPGRAIQGKEMSFRTDPGFVEALKEAGFSIVSLANNHTPNFGDKGLLDTFNYLNQAGIKYVGAGANEQEAHSAAYIESKGIKFAFLAYNDTDVVPASYGAKNNHPGTAFMDIDRMVSAVKEAKQEADFVIVSMHSGVEYTVEPNESQVNFAHAAIDAGAEMVIGHHPHVVQIGETYNGKYILYSLGNFVFDQMWSQATREGLIAKAFFNKGGVTKVELQPVLIENYAQPRMLDGKQAEDILDRLRILLGERAVLTWNQANGVFEWKSKKAIYGKQPDAAFKISRSAVGDLNKNSSQERYSLRDGKLKIFEGSKAIWASPGDWWVDDFALADSTGDGMVNMNLSVWKAGNYGNTKPIWEEDNDQSVRNHLFVFDLDGDRVKPVWQSSNLDKPNCGLAFCDMDNDGKQELVVIEGEYPGNGCREGNYIAVWRWNEWGFYNEWRSPAGKFKNLAVEEVDGNRYVVVDSLN